MLLRLQVSGFKNLRELDVQFGPLTCFMGPNGVGKSNIFDAVQFLRYLAQDEIHMAAEAIRRPSEGGFGPLDLLWNHDPRTQLRLSADILVPSRAEDDFGDVVHPTTTLLNYEVRFRYSEGDRRLVLAHEELKPHKRGDAKALIPFSHNSSFRDSAAVGKRYGGAFISMQQGAGVDTVQLHGDGGSRGRPVPVGNSPRTVLGGTGTREYPTIVAARREMMSWSAVQFEPSSLRTPDRLGERSRVDEHGRHIAATLQRLGSQAGDPERIFAEAANQLARLVPSVRRLRVREDQARQHLLVEIAFEGSAQWQPPRSLSDGTLRFLALVVMQMDPSSGRVLCIEEPENGIHPFQVPEVVALLRDFAVDPRLATDTDENPLRQVILNSHSPEIAKQLEHDEVFLVETLRGPEGQEACVRSISGIEGWRNRSNRDPVGAEEFERWIGGSPRLCGQRTLDLPQ